MAVKTKVTEAQMEALPIVGKQPTNEKEENYLREICEFEFYNLEEPGAWIKFPYGNTRFQQTFFFMHGGKYRVPRHVARHLESKSKPIWNWRPTGTGSMNKELTGENPRFQMRPVFS